MGFESPLSSMEVNPQEEHAAFESEERKKAEAMTDEELLQAFKENELERSKARSDEENEPTVMVGSIPRRTLLHTTHVALQDEIEKRHL